MNRLWHLIALTTVLLALALTACASTPTAATPTTAPKATTAPSAAPTAQGVPTKPAASPAASTTAPKYGGVLNLALPTDVTTFDDFNQGGAGISFWNQGQQLVGGDWTKGAAGGYGTNDTDWHAVMYSLVKNETGYLADNWKIDVDTAANKGTLVFNIRQGVHFSLNPASDASKAVGGRELTADDVVAAFKQSATDKRAWNYRNYPQLRENLEIAKTGPWQVTVKIDTPNLINAFHALAETQRIYPAELANVDTTKWQNQVTTGPFMLANYVAGSSFTLQRNPNYYMKDPVGPGKGNQLPYVDGLQIFIITDASTRLTAFRTGKIDQITGINWEDANQLKKEAPQMPNTEGDYYALVPMYIRTDLAPYSDVRVRRALTMATDFNAIKQNINGGNGIIITFPYELYKGYEDLYVDVDTSPTIKDMFTYNPTKAKQILADAGYPNGFKSSIGIISADTSYYEAIASMWAKVGVDLKLDIQDPATLMNNINANNYKDLVAGQGKGPATTYYVGSELNGTFGFANMSHVDDPTVNDLLPKLRATALTDVDQSHKLAKQMATYVVEQAYFIPRPSYRTTTFWWPWLKSYSGENSIGFAYGTNWATWIWLDQDLKKSMGR